MKPPFRLFVLTGFLLLPGIAGICQPQKAELKVQLGHSKIVYSVAFSPDGRYAASGSADFTYKLWEVESGREIRTVKGHRGYVTTICFSPDGNYLLTGGGNYDVGELRLWDVKTGKLVRDLAGHNQYVWSAIFNKDGSQVISGSFDSTIRIWDRQTGKQLKVLRGAKIYIRKIQQIPGTQFLVSAGSGFSESELLIWDLNTGRIIHSFDVQDEDRMIHDMAISPDGKWMVISKGSRVQVWDLARRTLLKEAEKHTENVDVLTFTRDGKYFFSGSFDNTIIKWETASVTPVTTLLGHKDRVYSLDCSRDDQFLISGGSFDRSLKLWDAHTGKVLKTLAGYNQPVSKLLLSNDGKDLYAAGYDRSAGMSKLEKWNLERSEKGTFYSGNFGNITDLQMDTAGSLLVSAGPGPYVGIHDLAKQTWRFLPDTTPYASIITCLSPDGKTLITGSDVTDTAKQVKIIHYSGLLKDVSRYKESSLKRAKFSRDGEYLFLSIEVKDTGRFFSRGFVYDDVLIHWPRQQIVFTSRDAGEIEVEFLPDGKHYLKGLEKRRLSDGSFAGTLEGKMSNLIDLAVSPDRKYIAGGGGDWGNSELKVWDAETGKLLHSFEGHFAEVTSVVFSTDNRLLFSGSADSQIKIWDLANKKELVTLVSMEEKGNDYVAVTPSGLFDGTPKGIRSILHYTAGLEVIDLEQLKERYYEPGLLRKILGYSNEPLRNVEQLGEVKLYPAVNLALDKATGKLKIGLSNRGGGIGRTVIYVNGKEVVSDARGATANPDAAAYSLQYNLKQHPYLLPGANNEITVKVYNKEGYLVSRGTKTGYRSDSTTTERPSLYLLAAGVSDYTGTDIDLKYPSKDAEDIAQALSLGAKRLFGTERTTAWLLTTASSTTSLQPSRSNITAIFDSIARRAKAGDVLVVYLSGHGINWGGANGDFFFLTKEAYSTGAEAYNDPAIRKSTSISGAELVELIKKIPALKQVLIVDACASGKAIDNMMVKRDISSGTLKALDRMKDRAGMHIITGCAADAVSYEATRYGQGVLTYSIIESIRGAALRSNRFIDIGLLFQYARERVPTLAEGIGGIQKPQVFSPYGAQSFDIGEMTPEDIARVKLAAVRPVFVRSNFQDEEEPEDMLGLSSLLDDAMEQAAASKGDSKMVFWDVRDYPDACKLSGRYRQQGNRILLKLVIKSPAKRTEHQLEAGTKEELVKLILEKASAFQ